MAEGADKNGEAQRDSIDALGYTAYAETLWRRIQQALNQDDPTHPLGDDPLVVGIFGEWGAGKSHLLGLIRAQALKLLAEQKKARQSDAGFTLTVPVTFQPWRYEHEPHLHVPLLLHVVNALKDALREPPRVTEQATKAITTVSHTVQEVARPTGKLLGIANTSFPVVQKILSAISIFGIKIDLPDEVGEWLESAAESAEGLANGDKKETKANEITQHVPTASNDGLLFYRVHELLAALTRPGAYAKRKDLFGSVEVTKTTRINFVVFVDDLDRCLPEKAVATLELIKTVFNVESFAFVLALDDEVIERGIAHRYAEYALKDRRAEMPITGFEYLEKIVHLPFRLPSLSEAQAQRFLCHREALIEPSAERRWFVRLTLAQTAAVRKNPDPSSHSPDTTSETSVWWPRESRDEAQIDGDSPHLRLVLKSFEAFGPRKLLRIVELWQQIVRVNAVRTETAYSVSVAAQMPGMTWNRPSPEGRNDGLDTRVVFALVLLQLFQPDLYRFMRRRPEAFPALLGAFMTPSVDSRRAFLGHRVADVDLWRWACRNVGETDADLENVHDVVGARAHVAKTMRDDGESGAYEGRQARIGLHRFIAERVRIGLVERLVEHQAAQRHLFNPLRMFHELANQLPFAALEEISRLIDRYFAVLANVDAPPVAMAAATGEAASAALTTAGTSKSEASRVSAGLGTPTVSRNEFSITDISSLAAALVSEDAAQRANLRDRFELRDGALLREQDAAALADRLRDAQAADSAIAPLRIAALGAIAPWLSWSRGGHRIVSAVIGFTPSADTAGKAEAQINEFTKALAGKYGDSGPKLRAEFGDLLNRFAGGDPRFDSSNPVCMVARWGNHKSDAEPIPGFVRIPAGEYPVNETGKKTAPLKESFLIARTTTTVAQFARFIESGGFLADEKRYIELPRQWEEQVRFGNRPVWGVKWFTARAYCGWLSTVLRAERMSYTAMLPTEWQWQCAARLQEGGAPHSAKFPWGRNDEKEIARYGNTAAAGIKRVSAVGAFEATGLGLYDMAGNLWEWMDNEGKEKFDHASPRIGRTSPKFPALRGGSWLLPPEDAACSLRLLSRPDNGSDVIGFRVVLSLAKSEA